MRVLIIGIVLAVLLSAWNCEAAVRRLCKVSYETQYGWSKSVVSEVTFATGAELNRSTNTFNYSILEKYALIWFSEDQVAILKINDFIIVGGSEFTAVDFKRAFSVISSKTATQVNTEYERNWRIEAKDFIKWIDPRVDGDTSY